MKVDNILQKDISIMRNETSEKKSRAADCNNSAAPLTNDRVSISSLITHLNHSVTSSEDDQARTDRVKELKALIENGNYNISGQQVAAKMLSIAKK